MKWTRADQQHAWTLAGDDRGTYGDYPIEPNRDWCWASYLLRRGELTQVVDAEAFFDVGDLVDDPFGAGLTEPPVLLVFEGLGQVAKFLSGHHVTQRGENDGVFTCLVRLIHPDESQHVLHQSM